MNFFREIFLPQAGRKKKTKNRKQTKATTKCQSQVLKYQ